MRNFTLLFALVFLMGINVFAQTKTTTLKTGGPEITFESEVVDYGTIKQDENGIRYFKFKNTGDAPLIIQSAVGSCGCTVPKYPNEPILPGQSSQIEVKYDTHRVGAFSKNVTITTNATDQSKKVLTIKGTVTGS